jgi:hypothetical protein
LKYSFGRNLENNESDNRGKHYIVHRRDVHEKNNPGEKVEDDE